MTPQISTYTPPRILAQGSYDEQGLERFLGELPQERDDRDILPSQLAELFKINNPELIYHSDFKVTCSRFVEETLKSSGMRTYGDWIYFSSSRTLLHTLSQDELFRLRTDRNKNLITDDEQRVLLQKTLAIIGLSVGGHFATTCAYGGIGGHFKLADFDTLDTTNLNRLRARLIDVETPKINLTADAMHHVDPHLRLSLYPEGISESMLPDFFAHPKPDIIFEAIDDFRMKIILRVEARKLGIPFVMLTSLGDNILVDIERFDLNPLLSLFHGFAGNTLEEILSGEITPEKEKNFALAIVGRQHIPLRAIETVGEIGKTRVGRPQLASTVFLNGGLSAYIARTILLGDRSLSGRFFFSLPRLFIDNAENNEQ